MRAQVAFWYDRDRISQGELVYQRESHRRLNASLFKAGERLGQAEADLSAAKGGLAALEAERARLSADLAAAQARGTDLAISNESYRKAVAAICGQEPRRVAGWFGRSPARRRESDALVKRRDM